MLLHLPIVILATLSPIAVSDTFPRFDIAKECRFESESSESFDRCSQDEAAALQQLKTEWPQFIGDDRIACFAEATNAGFSSYVDLVICLKMAKDVRSMANPTGPRAKNGAQPTRPAKPEVDVVDRHD
jgi:hypothetical protein